MSEALLSVSKLQKSFDTKKTLASRLRGEEQLKVYAVDNVTFDLKKGEVLGLIGESGCGKSTTAKILLKLLAQDGGEIIFKGKDSGHINKAELAEYRQKVQIVFQDPYEYLNPRINILDIVSEPLVIHKLVKSNEEKIKRVEEALEMIGLIPAEEYLYRFPHELSGGQRQRVAIARALIINPELIVADEPTSMLDVSIRAGILNLLLKLKNELGLSMIFITHDISTAAYMCDRIAVMYKGRIVEIGPTKEIIFNSKHPYTKALVEVAHDLEHFLDEKDKYIIEGEVDNYVQSGYCSFQKRCVRHTEQCDRQGDYVMEKIGENHFVACCNCHH